MIIFHPAIDHLRNQNPGYSLVISKIVTLQLF